jgi:hypothetical protein
MSTIPITESQLDFVETFHTPKELVELLFHNYDNLNAFDPKRTGEIRLYQEPLLSKESLVDFDMTAEKHNYNAQEKFDMQKRVGDIYCFGARKFGKTMVVETLDLVVQMLTHGPDKVAFASVDLIHLRQVLDPIKNCFESHPICSLWKKRITGAPDYKIELKNDWVLNSVNFNIGSKNPGAQWFGKHVFRVYIEEASLETQQVYDKRKDALSEMGAIFRVSGMTDFTVHSPAGETFYNPKLSKWVVNLPQYVNPTFTDEKDKEAEEKYGGKGSIGYRIYVEGEIVEDGISVFDMERIRRLCIHEKKIVKLIEISKDQFKYYKQFILIDRPNNAERIFIDADIGVHTTEINIFSECERKYEYVYNITLHNLTDDEQATIFKYLAVTLKANIVGLDCGDGMGRAIYNELEKVIPKENLVWYDGSMKIDVGFESDEKGELIFKDGSPVVKKEIMAEWSVKRLKDLFYEGRMIIPEDYKFISQFGQVISLVSGTRVIYKCASPQGDHLFDSFKVFAIAQWLKADFNSTPDINDNWGDGIIGGN